MRIRLAALVAAAVLGQPLSAEDERFVTDAKGRTVVTYLPMEDRFKNPWPADWEDAFWDRANHSLAAAGDANGRYGNPSFENEKQMYPNAFIDFMKGNRKPAIDCLQAPDCDYWNDQTLMVDWYPCFTIRSQVRKFFFFGQYLSPEYRKTFLESARLWTEQDPLRRPNKAWKKLKDGWTPETMNSWVDVRNTDNLRAMRECAVYLMAEEVGSTAVRDIYKKRIQAYVTALYTTGMGEWDSVNYMGHTMVGYVQLYDFAKDPEVKLLGKAAMDWLSAAAAVKYYRGSWIGPNKRDYNNMGPYSGAAGETARWFGDCPAPEGKAYRDWIHFVTSPYRPPAAVVHLAQKDFPKPLEILASKPSYEGWFKEEGGEDQPESFETMYVANSYQIGSLSTGHNGDCGGFRLGTWSSTLGCDTWIIATSPKGYKGIATGTVGGDQVGQYRNLLAWLNPKPEANIYLLMPTGAAIERDGDTVFMKAEKTWIAIHLVNLKDPGVDQAVTDEACFKTDKKSGEKKASIPNAQVWSAKRAGDGPCGVVLELGEQETHGDFAAFKAAVKAKAKLDVSQLASAKRLDYTASDGAKLGIVLSDAGQPQVFRNGKAHDWKDHWALYAGADGAKSPIALGWKQGVLTVAAGGATFTGTMKDGVYRFENR